MAIFYGLADSEKELQNKYPNRFTNMDDVPKVLDEIEKELDAIDTEGFFSSIKRWNKNRKINKFHHAKMFHTGAIGENKVVSKLQELSDDYHIICGVNIRLPYWITYRNKKNLRSAQMDVVVVSTKGVFLIEVKNWSGKFTVKDARLNPYEQTERAGRVLWIHLQNVKEGTPVKNVLLSVQGSFEYNSTFKSVYVSNLEKIIDLLQKGTNRLTDNEVQQIVKKLLEEL